MKICKKCGKEYEKSQFCGCGGDLVDNPEQKIVAGYGSVTSEKLVTNTSSKGLHKESVGQDFYKILGIPHDADITAIKQAASNKMNEIKKIYAILGDPQKRKAYDARLKAKGKQTKSEVKPVSAELSNAKPVPIELEALVKPVSTNLSASNLSTANAEKLLQGYLPKMQVPTKLPDNSTSAAKKLLEEYLPKIRAIVQSKIGSLAQEVVQNDESMSLIFSKLYEALPLAVRLVIKQDKFVAFCMENRDKLIGKS